MYTKEFVDVLVRLSLGQKLLRKDEVLIYLKMRSQWSFVHMFCTVINIWMKLVSLKSINLGIKMGTNLTQFKFEMSKIWLFEGATIMLNLKILIEQEAISVAVAQNSGNLKF